MEVLSFEKNIENKNQIIENIIKKKINNTKDFNNHNIS